MYYSKVLLFDGHCDAPWAEFQGQKPAIDSRPVEGRYIQVLNTFFSDSMLVKESKWSTLFSLWDISRRIARRLNLPILTERPFSTQYGIILGIEGLDLFSGNMAELEALFVLGYRLIGLTWNRSNLVADGVGAGSSAKGLTQIGKLVVKWCLDKGVILDLAHLAEKGFWDVMAVATKPIVVSHANCYQLCPHQRNLTDCQIKALIANQGLIGITFVPEFLSGKTQATMDDIIRHLDHVLALGGENNVGFGSDFAGTDSLPLGITGPESWMKIIESLYQRYSDELVHKIIGLNWLRIINSNLPERRN